MREPLFDSSNSYPSLFLPLIKKEILFWKNNCFISIRYLINFFISLLLLITLLILPYFIFRAGNFPDSPPKLLSPNFIQNQTYFTSKAIPEDCQDIQVNSDYYSFLRMFKNETNFNIQIFPELNNIGIWTSSEMFRFYLQHQLTYSDQLPVFGSFQINKFLKTDNQYMYALFLNTTSPHSSGIYSSLFLNKLFKFASKSNKELNFINYPIPVSYRSKYILQSRMKLIFFAYILILLNLLIISFFKFNQMVILLKPNGFSKY